MKSGGRTLQVAFTYIGTIVGAGFATGQEILQFFTLYGWTAVITIGIASAVFIWLGIKLMLLACTLNASSYESISAYLFGRKSGQWISWFISIVLLGGAGVMLAGAGSIFEERFHLPFQIGLLFTIVAAYSVMIRGMKGIVWVNSIVVPFMLIFTVMIAIATFNSPGADNWLHLSEHRDMTFVWLSPFVYSAYNLSMAQSVLVPLGTMIKDRSIIISGGIIGGIVIGLMLLAGHAALSAHMPGIIQYEIPMGHVISQLGPYITLLYLLVIYAEIFTTFIANVYGLSQQVARFSGFNMEKSLIGILLICYWVSQIGFSKLLSTLYPLFGLVSLIWLFMLIWKKRPV